jgi:hypothetical protein
LAPGCVEDRSARSGPAAIGQADPCGSDLYHCKTLDSGVSDADGASVSDSSDMPTGIDCGTTSAADASTEMAALRTTDIVAKIIIDVATNQDYAYILYRWGTPPDFAQFSVSRVDLATLAFTGARWQFNVNLRVNQNDVPTTIALNSTDNVFYVGMDRATTYGSVRVYDNDVWEANELTEFTIPASPGLHEVKPISISCDGNNCYALDSKWTIHSILSTAGSYTFLHAKSKSLPKAGSADGDLGDGDIAVKNGKLYFTHKGSDEVLVYNVPTGTSTAVTLSNTYKLSDYLGSTRTTICGIAANSMSLWIDDCTQVHKFGFELGAACALGFSFLPTAPTWADSRLGPEALDNGIVFVHQADGQVPEISLTRY